MAPKRRGPCGVYQIDPGRDPAAAVKTLENNRELRAPRRHRFQRKIEAVLRPDFAAEAQADALAVFFGAEKGGKQVRLVRDKDAPTRVGDDEPTPRHRKR